MTLLQILVVLAVIGAVGAVAAGVVHGGLPAPTTSVPESGVDDLARPEGALTADDVSGLRFSLALRGYRMAEVDAAIDRLAGELAARDAEIERLRAAAHQG